MLVDGVAREATISGLTPSTQYFVQVAAVNGIGTGPFIGTLFQTEGRSRLRAVGRVVKMGQPIFFLITRSLS